MKKVILLFLLVLLILSKTESVEPSKAPSLKTMGLNAFVLGLTALVVFDFVNNAPFENSESYLQDGFFVSLGLDPKMAINEDAADVLTRVGYAISKNEAYLSSEIFPELYYYSAGAGCNRVFIDKKLSLLGGVEYTLINRCKGKYYSSIGANLVFRYNLNKHVSVEATSNLKSRPDISKRYMVNNSISLFVR